MFIYNVTTKVDWSIHDAWLQWMRTEHMNEVVATGCFHQHRLLRIIEIDDTDGPTYAAQYTASSKADYNRYINNYADSLRNKTLQKWGNRLIAFRSLMQEVDG